MKKFSFVLALLALSGVSSAATTALIGVPSGWRIENYVGGNVTVWFSGSACPNGQLTLPSTATAVDHSRLFATVLAGKNTGTRVFIYYDNAVAGCPIISFGAPEN